MKSLPLTARLFCFALLVATAHAADTGKSPASSTDLPAPTAAQRADYPLKTCIVTGDDLDEMGHPVSYTYKESGKPDRVVFFCCKDCVADFEKEPAKYLKTLDDAKAKASAKK